MQQLITSLKAICFWPYISRFIHIPSFWPFLFSRVCFNASTVRGSLAKQRWLTNARRTFCTVIHVCFCLDVLLIATAIAYKKHDVNALLLYFLSNSVLSMKGLSFINKATLISLLAQREGQEGCSISTTKWWRAERHERKKRPSGTMGSSNCWNYSMVMRTIM